MDILLCLARERATSAQDTRSLYRYMEDAVLPEVDIGPSAKLLPIPGHKSHSNSLAVRPHQERLLEEVHLDFQYYISCHARAFLRRNISHDPMRTVSRRLTVPSGPLFKYRKPQLGAASNMDGIQRWLEVVPLQTVQTIMHMAFLDLYDWQFVNMPAEDADGNMFRYFYWTERSVLPHDPAYIAERSVVVAFQPPWILSQKDFATFARCKTIPDFEKQSERGIFDRSEHRLWAKLWDTCFNKRSHWFVLTNTVNWMFGRFTEGWTRALIYGVHDYDSRDPTIVQSLVFWLAFSHGMRDYPAEHRCPEPAFRSEPELLIPVPMEGIEYEPSESSWDGKSQEPPSCAGVSDDLGSETESCSTVRPERERTPTPTVASVRNETQDSHSSGSSTPVSEGDFESVTLPSCATETMRSSGTPTLRSKSLGFEDVPQSKSRGRIWGQQLDERISKVLSWQDRMLMGEVEDPVPFSPIPSAESDWSSHTDSEVRGIPPAGYWNDGGNA